MIVLANKTKQLRYKVTAVNKNDAGGMASLNLDDPNGEPCVLHVPKAKQDDPDLWKPWLKGLGYTLGKVGDTK